MQIVGADLFESHGHQHLVIVDQYSGYLFVRRLNTITSRAVIKVMEEMFNLFGYPEWVISDNGRQFASREFNEFLTERGIQPRKTSPYYPQSNGLSKSGVKIAKNLLAKCGGKMDKFDNALSSWRDVPNCSGKSPNEMFLARRTRVGLPMLPGKTGLNVQAAEEGAEAGKTQRGEHYKKQPSKPRKK